MTHVGLTQDSTQKKEKKRDAQKDPKQNKMIQFLCHFKNTDAFFLLYTQEVKVKTMTIARTSTGTWRRRSITTPRTPRTPRTTTIASPDGHNEPAGMMTTTTTKATTTMTSNISTDTMTTTKQIAETDHDRTNHDKNKDNQKKKQRQRQQEQEQAPLKRFFSVFERIITNIFICTIIIVFFLDVCPTKLHNNNNNDIRLDTPSFIKRFMSNIHFIKSHHPYLNQYLNLFGLWQGEWELFCPEPVYRRSRISAIIHYRHPITKKEIIQTWDPFTKTIVSKTKTTTTNNININNDDNDDNTENDEFLKKNGLFINKDNGKLQVQNIIVSNRNDDDDDTHDESIVVPKLWDDMSWYEKRRYFRVGQYYDSIRLDDTEVMWSSLVEYLASIHTLELVVELPDTTTTAQAAATTTTTTTTKSSSSTRTVTNNSNYNYRTNKMALLKANTKKGNNDNTTRSKNNKNNKKWSDPIKIKPRSITLVRHFRIAQAQKKKRRHDDMMEDDIDDYHWLLGYRIEDTLTPDRADHFYRQLVV